MSAKRRAWARHARANPGVVRLVTSHLLSVFGEWAAVIGVLVYAYERGGARATGIASVVILTPSVLGAPVAAVLTDRYRALAVRQFGLGVQAAGFALTAGAIAAEMSLLMVVSAAVTALGAVTLLRPTGAVLLPAAVHSSSELTRASLWISHCESASAFLGPLAAGMLLAAGSPSAALGACAVAAAAAFVISTVGAGDGPPPAAVHVADGLARPLRVLESGVRALRRQPRNVAVVAVVGARYLLIGALDVLVVVIAFDRLGLGTGGAGLLGALVGAGAAASMPVTRAVAGRANLTSALVIGLAIAGMSCMVLGTDAPAAVIYAALPLVGLCASSLNNLGRILLQRSADPRELGAVFAFVELVAGLGMLTGSGLALLLVELQGPASAPIGVGVVLLGILVLTVRPLWLAAVDADVPVVEMSLLRALPMFAPLAPLALEAVARSVEHVAVDDGTAVVRQGDVGDRFYAVVDGQFEITQSGEYVRTAQRGSFFGEVALLADVPRTAIVVARGPGQLVAVDRVPFLRAVTGTDSSHAAAWGVVHSLNLKITLPPAPRLGDTASD